MSYQHKQSRISDLELTYRIFPNVRSGLTFFFAPKSDTRSCSGVKRFPFRSGELHTGQVLYSGKHGIAACEKHLQILCLNTHGILLLVGILFAVCITSEISRKIFQTFSTLEEVEFFQNPGFLTLFIMARISCLPERSNSEIFLSAH